MLVKEAPEVAMNTYSIACDDKIGIVTMFGFHCMTELFACEMLVPNQYIRLNKTDIISMVNASNNTSGLLY